MSIIDKLLSFTAQKLSLMPVIDGGTIILDEELEAKSQKDITVSFNKSFSKIPNIMLSLIYSASGSGSAGLEAVVLYGSQTKTGFTVRLYNNDSIARKPGIAWQAIYQPVGGGQFIKSLFSFFERRWRCAYN